MNKETFDRSTEIDTEINALDAIISGIKESGNAVKIVFTWPAIAETGAIDSDPYFLTQYLRAEILEKLESRRRVLVAEWRSL